MAFLCFRQSDTAAGSAPGTSIVVAVVVESARVRCPNSLGTCRCQQSKAHCPCGSAFRVAVLGRANRYCCDLVDAVVEMALAIHRP